MQNYCIINVIGGRMTDIEIARNYKMQPINKIAKKLGLKGADLIRYGENKAKIKLSMEDLQDRKSGKLVLVTAINPTTAGNGKTTVSIGLADALWLLKKKSCLALREPSLGPVFGMKGGATGGGYSQIVPMEDINLHFNGDFHAITSANNLLASLIDNHIFQGNELNLDSNKIFFKRCLDVNDRALRNVIVSNGKNETPREEHFTITAASEIMSIMCMSKNLEELKIRLGNILVGLTKSGTPVFARDLKAENAMAILLKDALKPNLVQTLAATPAIVHLGPFANIAHGCNSVVATNMAMKLADYCITEAGFGADLGAEKFLDFKCREMGVKPNCIVLIATIPALKLHGGEDKNNLKAANLNAVKEGLQNLNAHINILKNIYKLPLVVTLNKYTTDTEPEIEIVKNFVEEKGCEFAVNEVWAKGGSGAVELAKKVVAACEKSNDDFEFAYDLNDDIKTKIAKLSQKIYGTTKINYTEQAENSIKEICKLGFENLPVIVAKTQYSLSDKAELLNAPKDFEITVRDLEIRSGAGFIVVLLGAMLLMPGLSKNPAAINMTIDNNEIITGLF